jgi:hypothetical protein
MSVCERSHDVRRGVDDRHVTECRDCRDAAAVHGFFQRLATADDLAPSLPDPRVLLLKAELVRRGETDLRESDGARWAGVAIWTAIAISWLVALTWKLDEIRAVAERLTIVELLPGGAAANAILVVAVVGLVAFTVFAVAVHSLLAEL